jgi:hypothetical protein
MWLNIINQKLIISFILYILKVNIKTYYIINSDANYNSKLFLKNSLYTIKVIFFGPYSTQKIKNKELPESNQPQLIFLLETLTPNQSLKKKKKTWIKG